MRIVARRLTQEEDGIPGNMAHPDGPGRLRHACKLAPTLGCAS